ncbi:MAG: VCBS repeat-containing protein [Myxococcota bacterium]|nr:VCBS repeat-containing protein [Myxococcota bacterium]
MRTPLPLLMTLPLPLALATGCSETIDYQVGLQQDDVYPPVFFEETGLVAIPVDPCQDNAELTTGFVPIDEECIWEVHQGDLEVVQEWRMKEFTPFAAYGQVLMAPMVGQLTDDNQDGAIDDLDTPDIVLVSDKGSNSGHGHGILRLVDGAGERTLASGDKWVKDSADYHPYQYSNLALGDVDADGYPDIVFIAEFISNEQPSDSGEDSAVPDTADSGGEETGGQETGGENPVLPRLEGDQEEAPKGCQVVAVNHMLEFLWAAEQAPIECGSHAPAIADLEGDGEAEVVLGNLIIEGATGEVRTTLEVGIGTYYAYPEIGMQSIAVDLDGDGTQEAITGLGIHDSEGQASCQLGSTYEDGFPAAADMDGDGYGDVVTVGNGRLRIFDRNCIVSLDIEQVGDGNGGPPVLADFDGDGMPEIGIANATHYAVYESDGTVNWSVEVQDASSHATGSSVFDFEGDGRAEVLYADEVKLWIFDGRTGAVRYIDEQHASRTLHEYPVVADVDADGLPEIIVAHGGGHDSENSTGITVLGSKNGDWVPARTVWNQHAYSITNINDDGTLPSPAVANWPIYNSFRSAHLGSPNQGDRYDTLPVIEGICTDECESGTFKVLVRLGNGGLSVLPRGVPMTLYATGATQSEALVTLWSDLPLDSGVSTEPFAVILESDEYGEATLELVSDDDGEGNGLFEECNEDNNVHSVDVTCD